MTLKLVIKRVGENRYVSYLTGCVVRRYYDMQLKFAPPVIGPWEYAGQFVAVDGTITTFEWIIPDPSSKYPYQFRFIDKVTGAVSNTVTIDPLNPPPINGNGGNGGNGNGGNGGNGDGGGEAGFNVMSLIVVAVLVFLVLAVFGGGKK